MKACELQTAVYMHVGLRLRPNWTNPHEPHCLLVQSTKKGSNICCMMCFRQISLVINVKACNNPL
jgi:hypothetical protein